VLFGELIADFLASYLAKIGELFGTSSSSAAFESRKLPFNSPNLAKVG
jgi:hypothetical protein